MKQAELDGALAALSGRSCTHAYLLQNGRRFYLSLFVGVLVGLSASVLIGAWRVGPLFVAVVVFAAAPLADRRIVGVDAEAVVQARSAPFVARPTELLASVPFSEVQVLSTGAHDNLVLRLDGAKFVGTKGSKASAEALWSRQAQ